MRIYNICDHASISVVKHVQIQKMLGHETMVCFNTCGIPKWATERCGVMIKPPNMETFNHFVSWGDIIVVHTSVSSTRLLDVDTQGRPLVWACHDLVIGAERNYLDKINLCLVPSDHYREHMDTHGKFKTITVHRKVAAADWPKWSDNRINCTIMVGLVSNSPDMPYRSYDKALSLLGGRLIVQSAQRPSEMPNEYMCLETVEPRVMFERLAMFDTAWCGCGTDDTEFNIVVNNKFHEAIASGCVPILYRSSEMSKYASDFNCGITWGGEYPTQDEIRAVRESIRRNRSIHCLESEVPAYGIALQTI